MQIIKIIDSEVSANSTPNTYGNNRLFKVVTVTNSMVTQSYSNGTVIGNTTLPSNNLYFIAKEPTDTLAFSANVLLTPIAFQ